MWRVPKAGDNWLWRVWCGARAPRHASSVVQCLATPLPPAVLHPPSLLSANAESFCSCLHRRASVAHTCKSDGYECTMHMGSIA